MLKVVDLWLCPYYHFCDKGSHGRYYVVRGYMHSIGGSVVHGHEILLHPNRGR